MGKEGEEKGESAILQKTMKLIPLEKYTPGLNISARIHPLVSRKYWRNAKCDAEMYSPGGCGPKFQIWSDRKLLRLTLGVSSPPDIY